MSCCKLPGDFIGVIAAAIFDNNHFRRKGLLIQKIKHLLQRTGQAVFFVMGRDNDGEEWSQIFVYVRTNM
jgi:menaquinone-dependent protoporphyrinogen IX oxidase